MRKFQIKVNGAVYEVEVEEVSAGATASAPAASVQTASAPAASVQTASAPTGAKTVNAPMPGTILSVKVTPGQAVKAGDVLCVLEAMKMENEIKSPTDGTVATVAAKEGQSVNTGDLLVSMN